MANVTVWRPFEDLVSLREAMDRLLEESFVRPSRGVSLGEAALPVDMYETPDAVVIKARVPGVNPDDLELTATEDSVTISGKFNGEAESEESKKWSWVYRELWYGNFSRVVALPVRTQSDKVDASFTNGLLTLTIPKSEEIKPKSIKVKVSK